MMLNPYQLVDGRHGRFLANPNDFYIGGGLIEYGEYAEAEWQVLNQLLLPGKDVIEVGANIGALSVPIATKLDTLGRRLMVIEPQTVIFQNLCANLALNGLFNVMAANVAVSDMPGSLYFRVPDYRCAGSNFGGVSLCPDAHPDNGPLMQQVRAERLDDLVPEDFDVGLVKIDVEGFELKVLEGAANTIARHRPLLYVENDRLDQSKSLIEWLMVADYRLYWNKVFLFNPDNYRGKVENLFMHNGLNVVNVNMLALPIESVFTTHGFEKVTDSDFHPLG